MSIQDDIATSLYGPGSGFDPIAERKKERTHFRILSVGIMTFVFGFLIFIYTQSYIGWYALAVGSAGGFTLAVLIRIGFEKWDPFDDHHD